MFMFMAVRLLIGQIHFISNLQEGVQFKGFCNGNHGMLMGSFPFVQLKADIQRFGAVRHFDLEQSTIDLGIS